MLLMVEKGIGGGICHAVHRYAKANNKYMKDYDPSTESSNLKYQDGNNLYGLLMSQKLPVDGFKKKIKMRKFNQNYDDDSDKGYILRFMLVIPRIYRNYTVICRFYLKK